MIRLGGRMRSIQTLVVLTLVFTSLPVTNVRGQAVHSAALFRSVPTGCSSKSAPCASVKPQATRQPGRTAPAPHFIRASCAPQVASTPAPTDTPMPDATPAAASTGSNSPVLDQAQLHCTGGLSLLGMPTQTFRVGISGLLTRVDIVLCAPTKDARINLTVSTVGSPSRSSTASLKIARAYSDCAWYEFDYHHPLKAANGDLLRLRVASPNKASALWGFDGTRGDSYSRGIGSWRGHAINDFAFQTYMQRA